MTEEAKFRDRRRAFRVPTSIAVIAKTTQGSAHNLEINDLTSEGCGVTAASHPLVAGTVYGVKIDGLEGLVATARWTAAAHSGLQFDRPLHPAVADHVAARHPRLKPR
jgi:hypothetical protein